MNTNQLAQSGYVQNGETWTKEMRDQDGPRYTISARPGGFSTDIIMSNRKILHLDYDYSLDMSGTEDLFHEIWVRIGDYFIEE